MGGHGLLTATVRQEVGQVPEQVRRLGPAMRPPAAGRRRSSVLRHRSARASVLAHLPWAVLGAAPGGDEQG